MSEVSSRSGLGICRLPVSHVAGTCSAGGALPAAGGATVAPRLARDVSVEIAEGDSEHWDFKDAQTWKI